MFGFIIGKKQSQSQMFDKDGKRIPVTSINTAPCFVVEVRNNQDKGTYSVVLGFDAKKKQNKPQAGKMKKAGIETPLRFFKEFTIRDIKDVEYVEHEGKKGLQSGEIKFFVGDEIRPSLFFKEGDTIDVAGTSKGKGFQGVVKRYNFRGGPRTHGQSDRERSPGSIGSGTTPGRVYKGKRMAGRMGADRVTVKNLKVVTSTDNELLVKGLVPGFTNGLLEVTFS